MQIVIITDASILMDVVAGGLTKAMFSLPYQFCITDVLFAGELGEKYNHLLKAGLGRFVMTHERIMDAYYMRQCFSKPSIHDLFALAVARTEDCDLLVGHDAVSEVAKPFSVEIYDVKWLVKKMITRRKITPEFALKAFNRIKKTGSCLPWEMEYQPRLKCGNQ